MRYGGNSPGLSCEVRDESASLNLMWSVTMEEYAGLDVSLKAVSICVIGVAGTVLWRGAVANEPDVVAGALADSKNSRDTILN